MKTYKLICTIILFLAFLAISCLLEYFFHPAGFVFAGMIFMAFAIFLVESSHRMAEDDLLVQEIEQEISLNEQIIKLKNQINAANEEDREYLLVKLYNLRHQLHDLLLHRVEPA